MNPQRAYHWLKFAALNTLRNRRRSLSTVAITALGTAAILLTGGFALFTYESLAQSAARTTGHLIVSRPEYFQRDEEMPLQYGLRNGPSLVTQLLAEPDVRQVLPKVQFSGLISNGDKSVIMTATGIDPDAEFKIKGPFLKMKSGLVLTTGHSNAVMLGEGLARSLNARPGSGLTLLATTTEGVLNAIDVTVQGVFSTGVTEVDKHLVYTDVATAQRLLATDRLSSLGVFLNRMDATPAALDRLAKRMPSLGLRTWQDEAIYYTGVKALYDRIFGALGLIIGAIVVFVVSNTMAMAIIERTRELGALRAMGTLSGQLLASLAVEGLLLGVAGAVLGALFSIGASLLLLFVPVEMPPAPGHSTGYPLNISVDPGLYVLTLAAIVGLVLLASTAVAWRTVRRPVIDALIHV